MKMLDKQELTSPGRVAEDNKSMPPQTFSCPTPSTSAGIAMDYMDTSDADFQRGFPFGKEEPQRSFSQLLYERSLTFGEKKEKIQSTTASSSSSRMKARLQSSLAAARPFMPTGGPDEQISTAPDGLTRRPIATAKASESIATLKPTYQRPKHKRVFCDQCDGYPDGLRGEHELRRHKDREHPAMVKKYICIEPTGQDHPKPERPLSKCRACGAQKKYGAYYNAAAHLRRTHFRPKRRGDRESEYRERNVSSDWPPMSELKYWMKEVEEPSEYIFTGSQQDEAPSAGDTDDEMHENDLDINMYMYDPQMSEPEPQMVTHLDPFKDLCTDRIEDFLYDQPFQGTPTNEPLPDLPDRTSMAYVSCNNEGGTSATSGAYMTVGGKLEELDDNSLAPYHGFVDRD